ncbi:AAA family ATPase [Desertihabitans aurantiacus]|uniref:AAA family ATPase n=1 Tax=Desertihabitans aurantiacus TaxID=2282477 RepID=UPI000DF7296E|nr:AAA family ATPase [Desertihabitans aurantiacus]
MGAGGYVLGAPGSGKTAVAATLRALLPTWVVLDWDAFMDPAGALAGAAIRETPSTWNAYGQLVRAAVDQLAPHPVLLLGVVTPDELTGWPSGRWMVLDCTDEERRRRLRARGDSEDSVPQALADAADYRGLGLPVVDSTGRTPAEAARALVDLLTS